jgi:Gas vesicle synthesis protein GvpL/GvpF
MTETGLACYVYGVLCADRRLSLDGVAGVDTSFGVGVLTHRDLSAIFSRVSLRRFGPEALKQNLEDLDWVARLARAHNAVLGHVFVDHPVVPFRLCTLFANEAGVRAMLEREREYLLDALRRLRGRTEWSVKVLADPPRPKAGVGERHSGRAATVAQGSGRAYFERKKLERTARVEMRTQVQKAVEEIHARLERQATAATLLPAQNRRLSGHSGDMVLNGAYLVERASAEAFSGLVAELGERHRETGLRLELSGPFVPYNFVGAATQR